MLPDQIGRIEERSRKYHFPMQGNALGLQWNDIQKFVIVDHSDLAVRSDNLDQFRQVFFGMRQ
ncbi:hypothetical protein D3C72_2096030 [compost metagenome]